MSNEQPELMKASEVAEIFRVAENTVYVWVKRGTIKTVRVDGMIRFPRSEVKQLLEEGKMPQSA